MTTAGSERDLERGDRVAFVASHLLSRTVLLGQLLVRQVGPRQISRTEASVLDILGDGPRRITELAELAGLAQPTMTLLIRRLEENGWVTRDRLAEDGRVVMVTVAEATARQEDFARTGDLVVVVAGIPFGQSGSTNNLRVVLIQK